MTTSQAAHGIEEEDLDDFEDDEDLEDDPGDGQTLTGGAGGIARPQLEREGGYQNAARSSVPSASSSSTDRV